MNRFSHALKRNVFIIGVAFIVASCLFMSRASADTTDTARDGRLVTIHDRGETHVILTHAQTVRDALNDAHVAVVSQDTVEPSLDDRLMATDYTVNIYRARPVIVVDGAVRVKVMTAEQTAEGIVNTAGIPLHDEDRTTLAPSTNIVADGAAEILTIDRAKRFTLNLYGTPITAYSHEDTVGAMLAAKHITLSKDDTLSVSPDMPLTAGMTVAIWRNGIQTATVEKDITFPVRQIQDFDHPIGYSKIQTPGVKGKKSVTYEITIRDGKEVKRKVIQTVIITQPKEQVEIVGAKNNYSGSLNDWLYKLRMCETHGNYTTNTGNGYYGAYQFSASTWNSLNTGYARADLAPPAVQDKAIIDNTNRSAGLVTQNPGCYASTGISNKPPAQ